MRLVSRHGLLAVLTAVFALSLGSLLLAQPAAAQSVGRMFFPAPAGTEWQVIAGYNTFTHSQADSNDPYALDLARTDGATAGTPVLAPISGTLSTSSDCATIRAGDGTRLLICHFLMPSSQRNVQVSRGQQIGTVAPAGEAGNNGVSHLHLALSTPTGNQPIPFSGAWNLEGLELPPTDEALAYTGQTLRSTMIPAPVVDAGIDQTVRIGDQVSLLASVVNVTGNPLSYQWAQTGGTTVVLTNATSQAVTFVAPTRATTLEFRFTARDNSNGDVTTDTVRVNVTALASATSTPGTSPIGSTARFTGGSIPSTGFGFAVFGGGTNADLLTASGCPRTSAAFWVTRDGEFIGYVPGASVSAVNERWNALFNGNIPPNTPVVGKCR